MKKILLFARDPGGANAVIPLIQPLREKYTLSVYGKDTAYEKLKKEYGKTIGLMEDISEISLEDIVCWIKKIKPDFVITGTSADDMAEKYIWKACEKEGIPSLAILDQWVNYGIRFSAYSVSELDQYEIEKQHYYFPSKIIVMDEYAKCEMIKEGLDENRIIVAGQPHFDMLRDKYDKLVTEYSKELQLIFVSEPIEKVYKETTQGSHYWGYTEKTVFLQVQKTLIDLSKEYNQKVCLTIRLHPKENKDSFDKLIRNTENYHVVVDADASALQLIKNADCIIGMSSMFLLEAVVCGKPIISVQIGLLKENPLILARKGMLETVTRKEELPCMLEKIFSGGVESINMNIPYGATKKIINYVEAYIYGKTSS